jgi:hypothetical protein
VIRVLIFVFHKHLWYHYPTLVRFESIYA